MEKTACLIKDKKIEKEIKDKSVVAGRGESGAKFYIKRGGEKREKRRKKEKKEEGKRKKEK